ncbi:hypothetical protein, partial [Bradyrhizobium lablabi]|uniref:hypothetical protein n=1 Tax=Bradyrhizobium lablabi TaxID=722472 RepID=UPI001AED04E6
LCRLRPTPELTTALMLHTAQKLSSTTLEIGSAQVSILSLSYKHRLLEERQIVKRLHWLSRAVKYR